MGCVSTRQTGGGVDQRQKPGPGLEVNKYSSNPTQVKSMQKLFIVFSLFFFPLNRVLPVHFNHLFKISMYVEQVKCLQLVLIITIYLFSHKNCLWF